MTVGTGELWPRGPSAAAEEGDPSSQDVVQGLVQRVTYHDERSLYSVLRIAPETGYGDPEVTSPGILERVTAVGRTPRPVEGLRVRVTGRFGSHPSHGRQLEFELLEVLPPSDPEGLVRYLSSKVFAGVGEVLARRIVEKLGADALETIRDRPAELSGIPGLRDSVREGLVDSVRAELGTHQLNAFLLGLGLGPWQVREVIHAFGADCERILRADPYLLAERVSGIGFLTADRVAVALGFEPDSLERRCAGLFHALRSASGNGHSLLPRGRWIEEALALLGGELGVEQMDEAAEELQRRDSVMIEDDPRLPAPTGEEAGPPRSQVAYLPMLHTCEVELARNLRALGLSEAAPPLTDEAALARAEVEAGIELHPLQREAVTGLLANRLGLLTGGPGVGKTTIVRLVVDLAERAGAKVLLASPTGRAAKRLAEATGREASTVHRMLGFDPARKGFAHDGETPLPADLIVVDEISMLDLTLAHHLLKAVRSPTRLILVGDPDQLPSVGAGNVLSDLLDSGAVPVWRLTHIFRQRERSLIVENAHRILEGEWPELPERGDREADFYFFPAEGDAAAAERLVEVVTRRIPTRFGLDWVEQVQVLSPMYRGECGVDALNDRLREELGIGGLEVRYRGRIWRVGDRVIHTRNDYEKEIFNGDMGRIVDVSPDGKGLTVRYPERDVPYATTEFSDLQPAFAITVHRSQGGEFPAVVIPLVTNHFMMLQRHLLYTAVTRARRLVVLVGSQRALQMALDSADQRERESALAARLRALAEEPFPGSVD